MLLFILLPTLLFFVGNVGIRFLNIIQPSGKRSGSTAQSKWIENVVRTNENPSGKAFGTSRDDIVDFSDASSKAAASLTARKQKRCSKTSFRNRTMLT